MRLYGGRFPDSKPQSRRSVSGPQANIPREEILRISSPCRFKFISHDKQFVHDLRGRVVRGRNGEAACQSRSMTFDVVTGKPMPDRQQAAMSRKVPLNNRVQLVLRPRPVEEAG